MADAQRTGHVEIGGWRIGRDGGSGSGGGDVRLITLAFLMWLLLIWFFLFSLLLQRILGSCWRRNTGMYRGVNADGGNTSRDYWGAIADIESQRWLYALYINILHIILLFLLYGRVERRRRRRRKNQGTNGRGSSEGMSRSSRQTDEGGQTANIHTWERIMSNRHHIPYVQHSAIRIPIKSYNPTAYLHALPSISYTQLLIHNGTDNRIACKYTQKSELDTRRPRESDVFYLSVPYTYLIQQLNNEWIHAKQMRRLWADLNGDKWR